MKTNFFLCAALSVFSLSIMADMDFDNLAGIDYAVIVSTCAMWLANAAALAKKGW